MLLKMTQLFNKYYFVLAALIMSENYLIETEKLSSKAKITGMKHNSS